MPAGNMLIRAAEPRHAGGRPLARNVALTFGRTTVRALDGFWRHGNLFSAAAISFSALFSLLPLAILFLVGLQVFVPEERLVRGMGRLFGGLTDTDIILRTVREAYIQKRSFGLIGAVTLIIAATGVFASVQAALDRVWECRGRVFHLRFLVGALTMASSLLIFLGMLLATILVYRLIRLSALGVLLGWPQTPGPSPGQAGGALTVATALAQFSIFWVGYRFLPNAFVRWRDAWPGALLATGVWHLISYGLSWYLARVADYATLYHQLQAIMALLASVYGLTCSFLLGAEFVVQWTAEPYGPEAVAPGSTPGP